MELMIQEKEKCLKQLNNGKKVILAIYEKNCIISDLFKKEIEKLNDFDYEVVLMKKEKYEAIFNKKTTILPLLEVYENAILIKNIFGFKHYKSILEEIDGKMW